MKIYVFEYGQDRALVIAEQVEEAIDMLKKGNLVDLLGKSSVKAFNVEEIDNHYPFIDIKKTA